MTGLADANLVIGAVMEGDALHARATRHLSTHTRLVVPFSVSIELLLGAHARGASCLDVVGAWEDHFEVENLDVLYTAADALDRREVRTVFDAIHLAEAGLRGTTLHTADERLLRTGFPTTPF